MPSAGDERNISRLVVAVYSSHVSSSGGLQIREVHDAADASGRNLHTYTVPAGRLYKVYVETCGRRLRVVYFNSANTLTAFEANVYAEDERIA